jgi:hypothetical protein
MKRKLSIKTPVCPQKRLVIISYTTDLSFALERIGPPAAITIIVFYLLILYLLALPNNPETRLLVFTVNPWLSTLLFIESTTITLYTCGSSQLKSSSQQHPCCHLRPRHSRCDWRGETGKAPEVPTHQRRSWWWRRRRRRWNTWL